MSSAGQEGPQNGCKKKGGLKVLSTLSDFSSFSLLHYPLKTKAFEASNVT
jgi:hypothetical protein